MARLKGISKSLDAFLDMIAFSEGTINQGDDGYNVIVGSTMAHPHLMADYHDHPNVLVDCGHGIKSTAAGRYQILYRYWKVYRDTLDLDSFAPEAQDKVAIQLIKECHALDWIAKGTQKSIEQAIYLCRSRWASFPAAGYSQHENKSTVLLAYWGSVYGKKT